MKNKDRPKMPPGAAKLTNGPVDGAIYRGPDGRFTGPSPNAFQPGICPNPGGKPKSIREVVEDARLEGVASIRRLAEIRDNPSTPARAVIEACIALLDRGFGRPSVTIAAMVGEMNEFDGDTEGVSALLLAAKLEKKSPTAIASPAPQIADEEARAMAKAITDAIANGVSQDKIVEIIATSMRRPEPPPRPDPEPEFVATLDLKAGPPPEPAPTDKSGPPACEAPQAATDDAPPPEKAVPARAMPATSLPAGFAEFHTKKQAERDRKHGNGLVKLV